jgi:hypothetical protein
MSVEQKGVDANSKEKMEKREREWKLFESFRNDYTVPIGTAELSDRPDILIRGDKLLGVEITNLHIVEGKELTSEQRQKIPRERVVSRAQKLHADAGGPPVELSIGFNPACPIKDAADVEAIAAAIAEIAFHVQLGPPGRVDSLTFEHLCCLSLMYLGGEYADPRWKVLQGYSVPMLQVNRVRQVVEEKARKAKDYQPCDAYWLLIAVDFWDPAQDQEVEWPSTEGVDYGPYERIVLYKPAFRRVVEVPRA